MLNYLDLMKLQLKQSFVSVIINVPAPLELVMAQVDEHVKMRLSLQFISSIQEFFKNYSSILMVLLFQHPFYDHNWRFSCYFYHELE